MISNEPAPDSFKVSPGKRFLVGTQGLRAVRQDEFDVAVLDLKMEDMDGIGALKILEKMAPQMAVIMLTGHGSEQAASEGIQSSLIFMNRLWLY
jgi:DNA-binding NtrC family response regulator